LTATQQLPRVKWKFKFPIRGFLSGALGGFGLLLFLQQAAVAYPTRNLTIALVAGGGLFAVLFRNVAAKLGVSRLNARLTKAEQQLATMAPVVAADPVAEVVAEPEPVVAAGMAGDAVGEAWAATHVVPSAGMPAWSEPDKTAPPVTQLEAGLELRVLERANGLAQVEAYNGWVAWVDGRSLRRKQA
jgi:hypothetical protein